MSSAEWFHEGQRLQQTQRFAEAEGMFRRVVEADPKHIGGWLHLGLVCPRVFIHGSKVDVTTEKMH